MSAVTSGTGFYRSALPPARWQPDRDDQIVALARDQRVVHIGCTDAPLTREKLRDGSLLHAKLLTACERVVGVDIDSAGIDALAGTLGGDYLCADATNEDELGAAAAVEPTAIVAADVIEHIANPGTFLGAVAALIARCAGAPRLVLSTPNALSVRAPLLAAVGVELTHPDHCLIYSPATLARALREAGFEPCAWWTYTVALGPSPARRAFDALAKLSGRVRPMTADGLIVTAALVPPAQGFDRREPGSNV